MKYLQLITLALILVFAPAELPAQDQDTLETAKSLYASAAYDDALKVLATLADSSAPETRFAVDQYRAFCLIALGRTQDAQQVIEHMIRQNPLYQPSEQDTSPRMRAAFRDIRRRVLPGAAQSAYSAGRNAFEAKQYAESARAFKEALTLLEDEDLRDLPLYRDMRTVAVGFLELATAAAQPPPDKPAPSAARPTGTAQPTGGIAQPTGTASPAATETVAATPPVSRRLYAMSDDPGVIPPAVVFQQPPVWPGVRGVPPPTRVGLLSVLISEQGTVESATLVQPVHPLYDQELLVAAKRWRYKPATKDGVPIKFLKTIKVSVDSPQPR